MKYVLLTQGLFAKVSEEDFDRVIAFKWHASRESRGTKIYAVRKAGPRKSRVKIRMHRFIMGLPPGPEDARVVDHIDNDPLNNQRENLEIITQEENMRRSQGWKKRATDEVCL